MKNCNNFMVSIELLQPSGGADGTTSYYLLCFAKLINLLIIQHIHQLFKYNYIAPYCSILHRFAIIWVEFWVDLL